MSAPVKLPRRLPDASPRLDLQEPPADPVERERYWLSRAIRCIEHHGPGRLRYDNVSFASTVARQPAQTVHTVHGRDDDWGGWLPYSLRRKPLRWLHERLAELESGAA